MIFGDEPRSVSTKAKGGSRNKIYGLIPQTDGNVGPGTYFLDKNTTNNPWIKRRFTTKEPMSGGPKTDRAYYYTAGTLTNLGMAHPGSPKNHQSPGPGYYGTSSVNSPQFSPRRPKSAQKPLGSSSSKMIDPRRKSVDGNFVQTSRERYEGGPGTTSVMGTSPRITYENTILRDGVMFVGGTSNAKNSPFGPGYYFTEQDKLNKRSFNVRCASKKNHAGAVRNSPANNGNAMSPSMGNTMFSRSSSRMSNSNGSPGPHGSPRTPTAWHQDAQHSNRSNGSGQRAGATAAPGSGGEFQPIFGGSNERGVMSGTGPITLDMLAPYNDAHEHENGHDGNHQQHEYEHEHEHEHEYQQHHEEQPSAIGAASNTSAETGSSVFQFGSSQQQQLQV